MRFVKPASVLAGVLGSMIVLADDPATSNKRLRQPAHKANTNEFRKWHPHGIELARRGSFTARELPLCDFVLWLSERLKVPIRIDEQTLLDDGLGTDQLVRLPALKDVMTRTVAELALQPHGLVLLDDKHVMRVTTKLAAEEMFVTRFYPIADLIRTDKLPPAAWRYSPFLDAKQAGRSRQDSSLANTVDVDFIDVPLSAAAGSLARQLDLNIVIDEVALKDDGLDSSEPITLQLGDVPARKLLRLMLEPLGLTTRKHGNVLVITTQLAAEDVFEVRAHSALGLLYRLPRQAQPKRQLGRQPQSAVGSGGGMFQTYHAQFGSAQQGYVPLGPADAANERRWNEREVREAAIHSSRLARSYGTVQERLKFYPPAMCWIGLMAQDDHQAIAGGFNQLRRLTPDKAVQRVGKPPRVTAADRAGWDMAEIRDLVLTVAPGIWEEIGSGGGLIVEHRATMSLVIRQTSMAHADLYEFFALLRRSAHAARQ